MFGADYRSELVGSGVAGAVQRQGLKTTQSLSDAVKTDPLAAQVGDSLVGRLVEGSPVTLSEVKACEASKACTAGMEHGVITRVAPPPAP